MSFDDDNRDDPVVFRRAAGRIVARLIDDEQPAIVIDVPALSMRRSEVDPTWLALHDREREEAANGS
jgi:hypothetical protein